ncbi:MAG TPA: YraN family protein [Dissulfurispiraceae bacterium]|nr:YraN family protein [Dissulfurispiraceae bacterium]
MRPKNWQPDIFREKYSIIRRNYRYRRAEADIIAQDGLTLVFIEVKARTSLQYGQPFEAVGRDKQDRLRRIALAFLKRAGRELPVRFDVISIVVSGGKRQIEHIEGAF